MFWTYSNNLCTREIKKRKEGRRRKQETLNVIQIKALCRLFNIKIIVGILESESDSQKPSQEISGQRNLTAEPTEAEAFLEHSLFFGSSQKISDSVWQYQSDEGNWSCYSSQTNRIINSTVENGESHCHIVGENGVTYIVDVSSMIQINISSDYIRAVRRVIRNENGEYVVSGGEEDGTVVDIEELQQSYSMERSGQHEEHERDFLSFIQRQRQRRDPSMHGGEIINGGVGSYKQYVVCMDTFEKL